MPCLVLAGMVLAWCQCALALDPALDVSQYAHTSWKIREGFSQGIIYAIAQTPDGYLWLGTQFGLLRFDGVRTVPWQPPAGQHLPTNTIESLLVARDGTLWIGTWKGLASWKDGKLTQYPELTGLLIMALLQDREGTVWAGGFAYSPPGKLCAIRKSSVQCYGEDGALGHGAVGLYEDSKGSLWAGAIDGLWRWKPGPAKFYPLAGEPAGIQGLTEGDDSALLIAMSGRVARLVEGKPQAAYRYPAALRKSVARTLLRDRDGSLWTGTARGGLVHVHRGITEVFAESDGLSGDTVTALFQDREGDIWVATTTGLDRFRDFAVVALSGKQGFFNGPGDVMSVLAARDESVWVGAPGGLGRWSKGQITVYHEPEAKTVEREQGVVATVREVTLSDLPITAYASLFEDGRGRIWVAADGGVGYLENDRFNLIRGVPGGAAYSIAGNAKGNLWISNLQHGLLHVLNDSLIQQIPWAKLGNKGYADALAADPLRGGLWVGFHDGGVAYLADDQVRASYGTADGLGEGHVNSLRLDRDGTLWAATEGGLSRLINGHVATLTSENGLPCDTVHWAMEDDNDSVWLNMSCGLVRMARSDLDAWVADPNRRVQTTVFGSSDGVRSRADVPSMSPNVAKSADGRIWFTTYDAVSVIDPRHLPFNKLPPPVHIEQITADRKSYDTAAYANGRVPLPAQIRDLEIDYTALSLVAPEKVRFRYKLEGLDRDWHDAGNRRQAFYSNLPPRNYRFRVIACNNSGVWNEAGGFLDFSVAPAYYQTIWFRLSCVAAFLGLLWAVYQQRLRRVAREFNMRLDERVSERTRIARELHDTLLQSFQGLILNFQSARNLLPARPDQAIESLDTALDRAERAIVEGRDAIHDMRASAPADGNFAEEISALGEQLASENEHSGASSFRVVVEGSPKAIRPVVRDEIYRIAREALRNAYDHAHARTIEAEITYEEKLLRVRIRDDGIGINETHLGEGRAGHYGLRGMRERATHIGAQLEVWSEGGAGTEIELRVPDRIAYKADGQHT